MQIRIDTSISKKRHICNATAIIDEFAFHDIEIWYGRKGFYLIFPSRMYHPIKEITRQDLLKNIINKLKQYPDFIRMHGDKI